MSWGFQKRPNGPQLVWMNSSSSTCWGFNFLLACGSWVKSPKADAVFLPCQIGNDPVLTERGKDERCSPPVKSGDRRSFPCCVMRPEAEGWDAAGQRDVLSPPPYLRTCSWLLAGSAQEVAFTHACSSSKATSEHTCNRAGACSFTSSMKVLWKPMNFMIRATVDQDSCVVIAEAVRQWMFSKSGLLFSCQDPDCSACQGDQELSYNILL